MTKTAMTTTAEWPTGVIARYLTVAGATVDVSTRSGYYHRTDPTETVATCLGCDKTKKVAWTREIWSDTSNQFVEETDEGGQYSTPKVREWAQGHAEKCRAMPKPNQA